MPIKSPYNFVPLSDKVVFPDWADKVSHDIPFKDGISGKIDLEVTLQSDTYIRNGGKWDDNEKKDNDSDCQKFFTAKVNGEEKYIIPGTSFKGMIRNVVEIASFGKMQRVNDDRYSIRDLYYKKYTNKLVNKVKAGWLFKGRYEEDGTEAWFISPCSFVRIEQKLIELNFNVEIGQKKESVADKNIKIKNKEIWFKLDDVVDGTVRAVSTVEQPDSYKKGTIVITGQPSPRTNNNAKHLEFVFYDTKENAVDVSNLKKGFEFVNTDNNEKELEAWKYWKERFDKGAYIPVFYIENSKNEIESFGLAMMYRLPCDYSVGDTIKHTSEKHSSGRPDLSDLMFGYVNGDKGALRGRVQFSHFVSEKNVDKIGVVGLQTTVLGGPKPTFYPNYLEQPSPESKTFEYKTFEYKTFMDKDAKIRGWKRYPAQGIKASYPKPPVVDGKENEDVATKLIPIVSGTVFKGTLRFFNLKPEELGALIWAITWDKDKYCQHQIGMGKPLGLGRILVDLTSQINTETSETINSDDFLAKFKEYMNGKIQNWETSEQITELKRMADIRFWSDEWTTSYPILEMKGENEFVNAKRAKEILDRYSEIAEQHNVKIETKEEKQKQAEKEAKIAEASESLAPEQKKAFDSMCSLKKGDLKNKLKAGGLTEPEKEVLRNMPESAWPNKWQCEVILFYKKVWDK